jgi:hypothetical protein
VWVVSEVGEFVSVRSDSSVVLMAVNDDPINSQLAREEQ